MSTTQANGRAISDKVKGEDIHTTTQYTIGWICALPIELAAAVKMLDEEHPRLPQDPKDDNSYRFGRIGNHNIVIGCLPHGRFGLVSAASVALQMKISFDNLRIGLMVGIGGGVPSQETDIRLGDIVISNPTSQHGGVVQYDLGKTRLNGVVERIGSLNSPPNAILHVVTEMIAAQELGELRINTYLSRLAEQLPAYAFPSKLTDCLYQPHHTHKSGKGCLECGGAENQVLREDRDDDTPVIHYGTIASGNQVMKDAFTRDKLSHELGGVLCYEMEAAGLMNNFPCLVIRGISDYSDTHKNDGWRRYAAAVAAAYAKDLLGHLASAKVAQTETLDQLMGDLSKGMARNQTLIEEVGSRLDRIDEESLLRWLSPSSNFSSIQNAARSNFMPGTGEGVLSNSDFINWRDIGPGLLWLYGVAGCGKTTLTSKIIDHLSEKCSSGRHTHIAYWYFQFSNPSTQNVPSMLRSFIRQLATKPLPKSMQTLWKKHGPPGSEPSKSELMVVLTGLINHSNRDLYLVLDALDECPVQTRSEILAILGELRRSPVIQLHVLVTSRREPDIRKALESLATHKLDADPLLEKDVEFFVTFSLNHHSIQRWGSRLRGFAAERLLSMEERRFRWADLQIKRLQNCSTEDDFCMALNTLPESLEATYREALESVSERDRERVLHILAWLTSSFRELRSSEVAAVVAFPFADDVSKLCKSILITVIDEEAGDTIKLAHYSVKEFLILENEQQGVARWYKLTASLAHRYITTKLLDCLFDDSRSPYSSVLYDYAQWYWPAHLEECNKPNKYTSVRSRLQTLFSMEARNRLLQLLVCSRAQRLRSQKHQKFPIYSIEMPGLLSLKQLVLGSWKEQGLLGGGQGFERSIEITIGDISIWLANRCDKLVDALDLMMIMEDMGYEIPATLHTLLQVGIQGINPKEPARTTSKSWLGSSDLATLREEARTLAIFSVDMANLEGLGMLEVLLSTAVDFPESFRGTPVVSSKLVSTVITIFDKWQPQLHYTDLILGLLVGNPGKTHNLMDGLLHHIKLAAVDEELMALVALTTCAYEVARFFLRTLTSDPKTIEHAAPEVFRQLLFWTSSDSCAPLMRNFLALVAFDCHPSVTEVGISLRQGGIGDLNAAPRSYLGAETQNFNSSDPHIRNKVLSLLIDRAKISNPLQESTVSLIAEFFDLRVFSALLHKLWDKVTITILVLRAIARNKQISWPSFQRLILCLYAAGLPLSDGIATLIASSGAYDLLRWPIYQRMAGRYRKQ